MLIYDQAGQHTYTVEQMGVVYLASGTFTDWSVSLVLITDTTSYQSHLPIMTALKMCGCLVAN